MKKIRLFSAIFSLCTFFIYSESSPARLAEPVESSPGMQYGGGPFLLSLILSHGSGLYAIKQPQKAAPYLLTNIVFVDIPLLVLGGGIVMNKTNPDFFQGTTLAVAEYVANTLLLSIVISVPLIRFLECREVVKAQKASEQ